MTLRYIEGFDYLPSTSSTSTTERLLAALGWYNFGVIAPNLGGTGRFGGRCVGWGSSLGTGTCATVDLGGDPIRKGFFGCALNTGGGCYIRFYSTQANSGAGAGQFAISITQLGVIRVIRDTFSGTVLSYSLGRVMPDAEWAYLEVSWDFDTGNLVVRLNTVPIISLTGAPIQNATYPGDVDAIEIGASLGGSYNHSIDDIYVCDGDGSTNNSFLGNVRAQWLPLAGNHSTQWTSYNLSVANYQAASNSAVDDTAYVKTSIDNTGYQDFYNVASMANTGVVYGVAVKGAYRQDDARQGFVKNAITSGGVVASGASYATNVSYGFSIDIFETDPNTGTGWTYTTVNSMAIGPQQA